MIIFLGCVAFFVVGNFCQIPRDTPIGKVCTASLLLLPPFGLIFTLGMGFGIYLFFKGFITLKRKRFVENIPTSKIRSIAPGIAEVYGKVSPYKDANIMDKPSCLINTPISGTLCVYYETLLGSTRFTKSVPFYVSDRTGKILIDPKGAVVSVRPRSSTNEFMVEKRIVPKDLVYVLGTVMKNPYIKQSMKSANSLMMGACRKDGNMLFISDTPEWDMLNRLARTSFALVWCGIALFLVHFAVWLDFSLNIANDSAYSPLFVGGLAVLDLSLFSAWLIWKTISARIRQTKNCPLRS